LLKLDIVHDMRHTIEESNSPLPACEVRLGLAKDRCGVAGIPPAIVATIDGSMDG
jgi:hypothetical protein